MQNRRGNPSSADVELVVARYREDLRWLKRVPRSVRVTVYDKESDLPNVGREAHTYLHHIIARYDSLSPITVFCQGKPFDHAWNFHAVLRDLSDAPRLPEPGFLWIGHIVDRDDPNGSLLFQRWSKNENGRPLRLLEFWRDLWETQAPDFFTFYLGAQFAAKRELILRRPLAFYQRALEIAVTFTDAAHCFERCWDQVFGVNGIPEPLRGKALPIYLKPIRRLQSGKA